MIKGRIKGYIITNREIEGDQILKISSTTDKQDLYIPIKWLF